MMKLIINPKYRKDEKMIRDMLSRFDDPSYGVTLRNQRNVIKNIDDKYIIKKFVKITSANRTIYSFIRKTKAQRSYEYAQKYKNLGIETPDGIAYMETKRNNILRDCYYIYKYSDFKEVAPFLKEPPTPESEKVVLGYIHLIVEMHAKGIEHRDLNPTNILYQVNEKTGEIEYQVLDINRTSFMGKPLTDHQRFGNLLRVCYDDYWFRFIIANYEKEAGFPEDYVLKGCQKVERAYKLRNNIRFGLKKMIGLKK